MPYSAKNEFNTLMHNSSEQIYNDFKKKEIENKQDNILSLVLGDSSMFLATSNSSNYLQNAITVGINGGFKKITYALMINVYELIGKQKSITGSQNVSLPVIDIKCGIRFLGYHNNIIRSSLDNVLPTHVIDLLELRTCGKMLMLNGFQSLLFGPSIEIALKIEIPTYICLSYVFGKQNGIHLSISSGILNS